MQKAFRFILFSIFLLLPSLSFSQKVGLVLSGGGAKGCTHVGIIRALEENNIPIDYITGTSMGAIVGSFYAMGYTPDQMEELLTSSLFQTWLKGDIDDRSKYYFKSEEETPEFISFRLKLDDSLSFKPVLPTSVIRSDQLNQASLYLFTQATTACQGNFDSLFVPFRCVASDITKKKIHIHKSGDLGDAVRSSMAFPLVFKPVKVNGHLMVDGGIYDNFPVQLMKDEFHSDYIIGSYVADDEATEVDNDPLSLMERIIMQSSNNTIEDKNSTLLKFNYTDISLLDFEKAKQLIQIGYDSTIAHIDEIKAKVQRRIDIDSINNKRSAFLQKEPQLIFKNVIIHGVNPTQKKFLAKNFLSKNGYFTYSNFKRTYFKLLSDKKIAEIIPHAVYNPDEKAYDLILDVEMNDHFKFGIGGNISSTQSNQVFISAKYVGIQRLSYDISLDGQAGMLYDNVHFQTRLDFSRQTPFCVKLIGDINHTNFTNKQNAFFDTDIPSEAYNTEFLGKIRFCVPFLLKGQMDAGLGYGRIKNKFHGLYATGDNEFDRTNYNLGVGLLQYNNNSLSHKQYPISGTKARITLQYIFGNQDRITTVPMDSLSMQEEHSTSHIDWWQASALLDHYFSISKHFSLGTMVEGVYSTHPLQDNYMETLMMTPSFSPTKHSKMVFNSAFRANTFIAAGIKPIVKFNNIFHLRIENYIYLPFKPISPTARFEAVYDDPFSKFYGISELTAVAHLKFISIGVYGNWYSYPRKNWNIGINFGYLIFHDKLIEQ